MTIQTITYYKRSTGKTGQVLASQEVEKKLARVEKLYERYHGVKLGRYKLYNFALGKARDIKAKKGGYIQYTTQSVVGVVLDKLHKALGEAVRVKSHGKVLTVNIGIVKIGNTRNLARQGRGKARKVV